MTVTYTGSADAGDRAWRDLPSAAAALVDNPPPTADPYVIWKDWCAGISIADAVASALCQLIMKGTIPLPAGVAKDMTAGLYGLNAAFVDVDAAFLTYIKNGVNVFEISPPPVAPWPAPATAPSHTDLGYFEAGFEALGGALTLLSGKIEAALATHPELQVAYDAITVVISSQNDVIAALKEVLEPTPSSA